jgi:hypothetical protein
MDPSSITATTHVAAHQETGVDASQVAELGKQTFLPEDVMTSKKDPIMSDNVRNSTMSPSPANGLGSARVASQEFVKTVENPSLDQFMGAMFTQVYDADPPIVRVVYGAGCPPARYAR